MKQFLFHCIGFGLVSACLMAPGYGQTSGNIGYSQAGGRSRAEQSERAKRALTPQDIPPTNTGMFVEASVLMNVKADEYVAVFGVQREGPSVPEANERMNTAVREFTEALRSLNIGEQDIFVDFVTQPKIYEFELSADIAREKVAGFEIKKNVSVHYRDFSLIDKLMGAAAKAGVYDLIKVDYIVKDIGAIQAKLMEEASAVVKQRVDRYERLLGIKVQGPGQVYAERPSVYYPSQLYDSYAAVETESINRPPQRYTVQQARKARTFFFNALDGGGFDKVINPVVIAPMVQATLYLKVRYDVAQ
jgi:uncharacterized protein YggE